MAVNADAEPQALTRTNEGGDMAVNTDADTREVDPRMLTYSTEGQRCRMRIIEGCRLWALHQPWPRELPASSQQAGLKKPPRQGSERWNPRGTGHIHEALSAGGGRMSKPDAPP